MPRRIKDKSPTYLWRTGSLVGGLYTKGHIRIPVMFMHILFKPLQQWAGDVLGVRGALMSFGWCWGIAMIMDVYFAIRALKKDPDSKKTVLALMIG